ncbi:MAG: shikimate kinase [bacterium]|nr:shikimate kinase [bacterium]
MKQGITMIGMAGAGKSGVGRILAEKLGWKFVDLDKLILEKQGITHHEYMKQSGEEALKKLEEQLTMDLDFAQTVFSPPGSVIYWESNFLKKIKDESTIVYLQTDPQTIAKRLGDRLYKNGIIGLEEKGLEGLIAERTPLYEKLADYTFHSADQSKDEMAQTVLKGLKMHEISQHK